MRSVRFAAAAVARRKSVRSALRVRPASGGAELRDPLAIGIDQGDVDAVLRGAAHQPDRQHRGLGEAAGGKSSAICSDIDALSCVL